MSTPTREELIAAAATWLDAQVLAREDARLFGTGFVLWHPGGGCEHIPAEAVSIDWGKVAKARGADQPDGDA